MHAIHTILRSIKGNCGRGAILALQLSTFLLIAASSLHGQINATISGTITDPSGAVVANATVTVTNEFTGEARKVESNKQGFFSMAFGKIYYSDRPDKKEIAVETHPGDLTVHDGNLWHRVALSTRKGPTSLRRSMYVPYLTDEFQPKDSKSKTPLYHHLGAAIRKVRSWFS